MNAVNYFFGKEGGEAIEVSSGVHLYKYSCCVPKKAPASVEGKYGYIRYHVDVKLDIPYMPDMCTKQPFTVVRFEDLNSYPELQIANEVEEVKTFCCCLCESDPLMLKVSTKQSGYVLGDKIGVRVEIFNRTNKRFNKSLITLNRIEIFNSYTPLEKTRKFSTVMAAMFAKGVDARRSVSFEEYLQIPHHVSISNDRICDVFQVTYVVKVYLKAHNKSSSIEANVPIYIGTVGFRSRSTKSLDSASVPLEDYRMIRLFMF